FMADDRSTRDNDTLSLHDALPISTGSQLRLDPQALIPNQVNGSLNSLWLHPFGGLDYRFARNWTGRFYWDYYGYHEDPTSGAVIDRKSTRLNSSHSQISYAVFCLT